MDSLPWKLTLSDDAVVPVAPTDTVLLAAFGMRKGDTGLARIEGDTQLVLNLTNSDLSQQLDAWVESSWNGSSGWSRVAEIALDAIAPGEVRYKSANARPWRFLRLMGRASGAGLNCRVSAELMGESL